MSSLPCSPLISFSCPMALARRQPTEWDKICIDDAFDTEFISKIYKKLKKNSIASKPTTQLGHEQTMFKDGSRNNRETHERTQANREMKAITSAWLEGLSSRNQKITVYGEDVEIKIS